MDEGLKETLIRYGEFARANYDAFDCNFHDSKRTGGTCKYSMADLLNSKEVGLVGSGYTVTRYLYSTVYKWRWPFSRVMQPLPETLREIDGSGKILSMQPETELLVQKPAASNGADTLQKPRTLRALESRAKLFKICVPVRVPA